MSEIGEFQKSYRKTLKLNNLTFILKFKNTRNSNNVNVNIDKALWDEINDESFLKMFKILTKHQIIKYLIT